MSEAFVIVVLICGPIATPACVHRSCGTTANPVGL